MKKLLINSDVGEGVLKEAELMLYLQSCSVACGGHFGDSESMRKTVKLAIDNDVLIGAHPSYPDRVNFGRKEMFINLLELKNSLHDQISSLLELLSEFGINELHHIKAHGALYNKCVIDVDLATLYVDVVKCYHNVKIYAPYGSVVSKIAKENGVEVVYEVFLDRNYNDNHTLLSRSEVNSMIVNPAEMLLRYNSVLDSLKIKTISNKLIKTIGDTFCVHGDTNDSHLLLKDLYKNYFIK